MSLVTADATVPVEEARTREIVRVTAGKLLRSDDLLAGERAAAAGILLANPSFGYPHIVHCAWCRESRTLFRDESEAPFERTASGWRCKSCDVAAASQVIKF